MQILRALKYPDMWHHINNLWDSVLSALRSAKEPDETQLSSAWELTTLASSEFYFGDLERRRAQLLQRRTLLAELVDLLPAFLPLVLLRLVVDADLCEHLLVLLELVRQTREMSAKASDERL